MVPILAQSIPAPVIGQALCAVATIVLLLRWVLPRLREEEGAETAELALTGDVWIPLALTLSLVLSAAVAGPSLAGIGWAPVGAPIVIGWIMAGAAMAAVDRGGGLVRGGGALVVRGGALTLWAIAGVLLLLLGAAHDLSIMQGQLIFALAAVLLWWLSGAPGTVGLGGEGRSAVRCGLALLGALLAAAAGAIFALGSVRAGWPRTAILIACLPGLVVAGPLALQAGRGRAYRIAGFTAVIGFLLGAGALSLSRLLPIVLGRHLGSEDPPGFGVAFGFGRYAPEAMLLVLLPGLALLTVLMPRPARVAVAALMVVIGVVVLLLRVRTILPPA